MSVYFPGGPTSAVTESVVIGDSLYFPLAIYLHDCAARVSCDARYERLLLTLKRADEARRTDDRGTTATDLTTRRLL